jgi:hypothetical protein
MSLQLFKNPIPNELLLNLLNGIAIKTKTCFAIDENCFKKGMYNNTIPIFMEDCRPYYHLSKRKYLDKKTTYNSFITVIRQICKANKITYTHQIKYNKSTYSILYYIYLLE